MSVTEKQSVAMTGSPNNVNEIHFDVRSTHIKSPLLGTLLSLEVPVQGAEELQKLLVLGQVATIETQNRWHEDLSLKNYIKLNGRLPHLTEIGDVTLGKLQIIGAYKTKIENNEMVYQKTRLSVPPGSGLDISQVDRETIKAIMKKETGYGYLGNFYGSHNVPAPVYVKHFGNYDDNGTGEAYMGGVFGPSGSGKSVIAATLIALWAHNPQMGLLILDPASEFSTNSFGRGTKFTYDFHDLLKKTSGGRFEPDNHVIHLDQLQLEGADIFVQVLKEKRFFEDLGVSSVKMAEVLENATRTLEDLKENDIWKTNMDWDTVSNINVSRNNDKKGAKKQVAEEDLINFSELMSGACANAYTIKSRKDMLKEYMDGWENRKESLGKIWNDTVKLFKSTDEQNNKRFNVEEVMKDAVLNGQIRILDLNPQALRISDDFKLYLMDFVFKRLRQLSYKYSMENNPGNCLIVLDEAGRFIPQSTAGNEMLEKLCSRISTSVKEMRKFRCGFMFITQTIAEIQKEIFRQLHFRIYGVGLGIGADADHIISKEGQDAYELYKSLPDPRLSDTFSFMVAGVLISLGSSGKPMVIEGFASGEDVITNNTHLIRSEAAADSGIGDPVTE